MRRAIYAPYIRALLAVEEQLRTFDTASSAEGIRHSQPAAILAQRSALLLRARRLIGGTLTGRYIYWFRNRAL